MAERKGCRGTCAVPFQRQAGKVFVLNGFYLDRRGGDDNVRELAIVPQQARGRIMVTLRDNSARRPFDARIYYVMVPRADVYAERRIKRTSKAKAFSIPPRLIDRRSRTYAQVVLQGFAVRFTNGDHYFGRLAIDVGSGNLSRVIFRDRDFDDPHTFELMYAYINNASASRYR